MVDPADRAALEEEIASLCRREDFAGAATVAIEGYGPELYGFILTLLGNEQDGADVFSSVCERIWRGLPKFERRASVRTWAYHVTRNEVAEYQRTEYKRRNRQVRPSGVFSQLEERVRTATATFLRSQTKNRMAQLRATLPVEDQTLLILRVDRDMDWNDIAAVLAEGDALDDEALKRESARLRKRFQSVKERLRELAAREGLLPRG